MLFGSLFGAKKEISDLEAREKYGVQLPRYESLERGGYELRRYQAMSIVECPYEARPEGYELLGAYSSGGENALDIPMPKTCPAVMSPCLSPKKMFYVLPSPHTPLLADGGGTEAPITPPPAPSKRLQGTGLTTRVLEAEERLMVAVVKFSGYATPDVVFKARDELKALLLKGGDAEPLGDETVMMAQYNELFSLPWNRDNEVWLPIKAWPGA